MRRFVITFGFIAACLAVFAISCRPGSEGGNGVTARGGSPSIFLPPATAESRAPTILALFVTVSEPSEKFREPLEAKPLKYAETDARNIADDLHYLGVPRENVITLTQEKATGDGIISAVKDDLARRAQRHDTVFVFFFGHGTRRDGESHLAARDRLLSVKSLLKALGDVPADKLVFVMDACHSGEPGGPQFLPLSEEVSRAGKGVLIISSARAEQSAYESDALRGGVFSHYLSEVLRNSAKYDRNGDEWLDLTEIIEPVRQKVKAWAKSHEREQEPVDRLVHWTYSQTLLPVRKEWSVEVLAPVRTARVRVRFPTSAVARGDLILVVAPRNSPGQYWPQSQAVIRRGDQSPWEGMVYLGKDSTDVGGEFRVLLVPLDSALTQAMIERPGGGLVSPALNKLSIRAEHKVIRTR